MPNHNLKRASVLLRPRITEKSAILAGTKNVYVFEVERDATKGRVGASIREAYKVTPEKVNIVKIPAKKVFVRGKVGHRPGGKKAYVYLKEGDKIELL